MFRYLCVDVLALVFTIFILQLNRKLLYVCTQLLCILSS
jgi:hypothetical protein